MVVEYWSEDHDEVDWKEELKKLLGDKLIGLTITTPNKLIEIRTAVEMEPPELNEIKRLTYKGWTKQKR